jgi:hypothetical protein
MESPPCGCRGDVELIAEPSITDSEAAVIAPIEKHIDLDIGGFGIWRELTPCK